MKPPAINDLLSQLRSMAPAARAPVSSTTAEPTPPGGFARALSSAIGNVNDAQQRAHGLARQFEAGAEVPLHEVMLSLQKANIAFQGMVQVRNRLVQAYHDIMNMPV